MLVARRVFQANRTKFPKKYADPDDRRVDAAADSFDAVVRHGALEDSRLVAWELAPSRRLLMAAPGYLERHGTPRSLEELQRHRGIFYANRGVADWRLAGPQGVQFVRAGVGLRVNNGDVMRDAAVAGLGIALLPTFIAGDAIRAGALQVVDVGLQAVAESVYVALRKAGAPRPSCAPSCRPSRMHLARLLTGRR